MASFRIRRTNESIFFFETLFTINHRSEKSFLTGNYRSVFATTSWHTIRICEPNRELEGCVFFCASFRPDLEPRTGRHMVRQKICLKMTRANAKYHNFGVAAFQTLPIHYDKSQNTFKSPGQPTCYPHKMPWFLPKIPYNDEIKSLRVPSLVCPLVLTAPIPIGLSVHKQQQHCFNSPS